MSVQRCSPCRMRAMMTFRWLTLIGWPLQLSITCLIIAAGKGVLPPHRRARWQFRCCNYCWSCWRKKGTLPKCVQFWTRPPQILRRFLLALIIVRERRAAKWRNGGLSPWLLPWDSVSLLYMKKIRRAPVNHRQEVIWRLPLVTHSARIRFSPAQVLRPAAKRLQVSALIPDFEWIFFVFQKYVCTDHAWKSVSMQKKGNLHIVFDVFFLWWQNCDVESVVHVCLAVCGRLCGVL